MSLINRQNTPLTPQKSTNAPSEKEQTALASPSKDDAQVQAEKLATWVKERALRNFTPGTGSFSIPIPADTAEYDTFLNVTTELSDDPNIEMASALTYIAVVGNELTAGVHFIKTKCDLHTLKSEHEALMQEIDQLPKNDPAVRILTYQKIKLNAQIEKKRVEANESCFSFLVTHIRTTLNIIMKLLSQTGISGATTAAASGNAALGVWGFAEGTVDLVSNVIDHKGIDSKLIKLIKLDEQHENSKIATAIEAIKTIGIDHIAHHKQDAIKLGIFQNSFKMCNSALLVNFSIISAVGLFALPYLGISVPVLGGIGLFFAAGMAVYKYRHSIGRGLKGIFSKRGSKQLGRLNPSRNLKFRQWRKQVKLKKTEKKMYQLGIEHAELSRSKSSVSTEDKNILEDKVKVKDSDIVKKAQKVIALTRELEEIRFKSATQILRDETREHTKAIISTAEAKALALVNIESEINTIKDAINRLTAPGFDQQVDAYEKLNVKQKENLAYNLKIIQEDLSKLDKPTDQVKNKFRKNNEKRLEIKKDELHLLDPAKINEKQILEGEISKLEEYQNDIEKGIANEISKTTKIKQDITEKLEEINSPTSEVITSLTESYKTKLDELEKMHTRLNQQKEVHSDTRESYDVLASAIDQLAEDDLPTFLATCKVSFPGIKFDAYDYKQDQRLYIKTQIQKAITSSTLF